MSASGGYYIEGMNPPAPNYHQASEYDIQQMNKSMQGSSEVEVITLDHDDSRSASPHDDR